MDARTLVPFDREMLGKSLAKTHRLLIAHEECQTSGFAGEIAAVVNEHYFECLDAPILRVTSKDCHVAYCPGLEADILPQVDDIYVRLKELLHY